MTRAFDMTAAEFLEGFLPRWRASLPTRLAPFAERFLRLNRGVLEVLTQRALAALRARRGELPDTVLEFAAYDPIVARERRLDAQPDARWRSAGSSWPCGTRWDGWRPIL
jgi:hypothetical protein